MSAYELREALKGVPGSDTLTIGRAANGNQIITIGDKSLEFSPMASNDEIRIALQNPFPISAVRGEIQHKVERCSYAGSLERRIAVCLPDAHHLSILVY